MDAQSPIAIRSEAGPAKRARAWLHRQFDPGARAQGLSPINLIVAVATLTAVAVAIVETEASIHQGRERLFFVVEHAFGLFFAFEYACRLWAVAEDQRLGGGWRARWRWIRTPHAIIDVLAFAPNLLTGFAPAYILRLFRIARLLHLAQLGRFSNAWNVLWDAVSTRRYELGLTGVAAVFVLIISSTLMYIVEGHVQPEKFGSIPRALWWSVVTLTTIGYGDVYPATGLGKVLTGLTAILGIGLIAAPTGIVAAAVSEQIQRRRDRQNTPPSADA